MKTTITVPEKAKRSESDVFCVFRNLSFDDSYASLQVCVIQTTKVVCVIEIKKGNIRELLRQVFVSPSQDVQLFNLQDTKN